MSCTASRSGLVTCTTSFASCRSMLSIERFSARPTTINTTSATKAPHSILRNEPMRDESGRLDANLRPPPPPPSRQVSGNTALPTGMANARIRRGGANGTQASAQRDDLLRTRLHPGPLLHGHQVGRRALQPAPRELRHARAAQVVVPASREDRRLR